MLNDSQLLRLYGVFSDEKNKYLIMEPMLGGSLWENKKKFKTFKEKHVSAIVLNLCEAVKSLHEKDILHRDIKLENILLMEGVAKLADFGCAVKSAFMRNSQIGSRNYLSPEQYHSRFYDKKVDIWSIGIVTY
jgi:serine/threonine protein kinase